MNKLIKHYSLLFILTSCLMAGNISSKDNWKGYYIGVFSGTIKGKVTLHDEDSYNGKDFSYATDGAYSGIITGYNWQKKTFVYGLEGKVGYLNYKQKQQFPDFVGQRNSDDSLASFESNFSISLLAKAGFTINKFLFYAEGGITGLNVKVSFIDSDPTGSTLVSGTSTSKFLWKPTIGAGVEMIINKRWRLFVEYMHINSHTSLTHTAISNYGGSFTFTHEIYNIGTLTTGFIYKF